MSIWSRIFGTPDSQPTSSESQREKFQFLKECRSFSRLPASILEILAGYATIETFSANTTFVRQGETGDSLYVVMKGRAEVRVTGDERSRRIAAVGVGDVVGEMALVTRAPRAADVTTTSPLTALRVSAEDFDDLSHRHHELAVVLTDLVADRLGKSDHDALSQKDLGDCRIDRPIGRGGMAVVYSAREGGGDGAQVALKMMSHRLIYDSDALQRFHREADIAERLNHRNIARVYRRFEAFKTYFLVMELCDGPGLDDVVKQTAPLDESIVRGILGQLACALRHIHEQDVIHRDLKPSNVMFSHDGVLKLTDFGLALPEFDSGITRSGVILGTPMYMAPEQIEGLKLSDRCDIYALGCIAWELLTGRPPFDAETVMGVFRAKVQWTLPARDELNFDISEEMYYILERSFRTEVADRSLQLDEIEGWAAPLPQEIIERAQRNRNQTTGPDSVSETRAE